MKNHAEDVIIVLTDGWRGRGREESKRERSVQACEREECESVRA